jgi:transposase
LGYVRIGRSNEGDLKMARAYSIDLRKRVIEAYEAGEGSQGEIAKRFKIGLTTFRTYWIRYRDLGEIAGKEYRHGRLPKIEAKGEEIIRNLLANKPDLTLLELCEHYQKKRRVKVSISMMFRACQKLNLRLKKKSLYAQEQGREDV